MLVDKMTKDSPLKLDSLFPKGSLLTTTAVAPKLKHTYNCFAKRPLIKLATIITGIQARCLCSFQL